MSMAVSTDTSQDVDPDLERILAAQYAAFQREGEVSLATRIDRLDRCIALLVDNQDAIATALEADFGCRSRYVTLMSEVMICVGNLKHAKKHLRAWMKPERRKAPFPMSLFGARAHVHYQPKGVVGIMSPWNIPIGTTISPLTDALAAGNRCMLKPSEYTPATADLLVELFGKYFDQTEVAVCPGGPEVGAAFSGLAFNHLIFTGSPAVGHHIMRTAADNLTPVTLELGGKSPVIVSQSADPKKAAEAIITGKSMNAGQICLSPDYAFVPEDSMETFITQCAATVSEQFPTITDNPDFVSIINERHYDRLHGYLEDARGKGARIVALKASEDSTGDRASRKMPLHLIIDPSDDMRVMQEEIFGPILNLLPYRGIDDCIDFINRRPRPLALYYFGKDTSEQKHVLTHTTAGGVCINDVAVHYACDDLPFGGIGNSGMGQHHGFDGFKTFSHAKAVFKQGRVNLAKLAGTLPPYGEKIDKILRSQIKK